MLYELASPMLYVHVQDIDTESPSAQRGLIRFAVPQLKESKETSLILRPETHILLSALQVVVLMLLSVRATKKFLWFGDMPENSSAETEMTEKELKHPFTFLWSFAVFKKRQYPCITMAEKQEFNRNLHGSKYTCCVHLVLFDTQRFIFTSFPICSWLVRSESDIWDTELSFSYLRKKLLRFFFLHFHFHPFQVLRNISVVLVYPEKSTLRTFQWNFDRKIVVWQ